jgi:formate dehydrogenase subunit gamma
MTPPAGTVQLHRFGRTVRWVHGATGLLVLVCIGTAAVLYNHSIAVAVGHRHLIAQVHVYCGFGLLPPLLLGLASRDYREDLRRLNRFTRRDWQWLRSKKRRDGTIRVGKFNAGQKLNAALSAGAIAALLITGAVMHFTGITSLAWRSGATFTHDWFSLGLGLLVLGHLAQAFADTEALHGIRTGRVSATWARHEHEAWADEMTAAPVETS